MSTSVASVVMSFGGDAVKEAGCHTGLVRSLSELRDVEDPAWPELADAISGVPSAVALPVDSAIGEACLFALQVTARSTLGALALNCGGVVVDDGWLRVLGGGGQGLPSLAEANGLDGSPRPQPKELLVAIDVVGGRFSVNGGALGGGLGEVNYWAPDSLSWEPLGFGHSDFVWWALRGEVDGFYGDLRWSGWRSEVKQIALDEGMACFPPLCTREGRPVDETTRSPVPIAELTVLLAELSLLPDGPVRFVGDDTPS